MYRLRSARAELRGGFGPVPELPTLGTAVAVPSVGSHVICTRKLVRAHTRCSPPPLGGAMLDNFHLLTTVLVEKGLPGYLGTIISILIIGTV